MTAKCLFPQPKLRFNLCSISVVSQLVRPTNQTVLISWYYELNWNLLHFIFNTTFLVLQVVLHNISESKGINVQFSVFIRYTLSHCSTLCFLLLSFYMLLFPYLKIHNKRFYSSWEVFVFIVLVSAFPILSFNYIVKIISP